MLKMFQNSFLVILFYLFVSTCDAQIQFHYLDVRGQSIIAIDSLDSDLNVQQYFFDRNNELFTGKVYGYFSSTLISQFCVRDGVWDGFRETFVYGKYYPDSIAVIEYRIHGDKLTFKQRRKNKINERQLSFIRLCGQHLDVEYRIHQRSGVFFVKIIENFDNKKLFSKRIRFPNLSELKTYLGGSHEILNHSFEFLEDIYFFNEYYTSYKTGCLYN